MSAFDFASVGGKVLTPTGKLSKSTSPAPSKGQYWDFGWIGPDRRGSDLEAADASFKAEAVPFKIAGKTEYPAAGERAGLVDLWKHPSVVSALGRPFAGIHQLTGSCVGAGGGNAITTLSMVEAVRKSEPEEVLYLFWLLPYGRSRYHAGMRGPGEGSLGSAFAKAMLEDGILDAKESGLPAFSENDGLVWGERTEMEWSAGDRIGAQWLEKSRQHLVKSFAQMRSADQVRDAIVNGYPCTCASMWGMRDPREARVEDGYLIGRRTGQWSHQMSVLDWVDHPSLGQLFYIMNQWGSCYPEDPATGGRRDGVWVKKSDMDWICQDEVFCASQFNGFPARTFSWFV